MAVSTGNSPDMFSELTPEELATLTVETGRAAETGEREGCDQRRDDHRVRRPGPGAGPFSPGPAVNRQGSRYPAAAGTPRSDLGNLGSPQPGMAEASPIFPGGVTRSCGLSAATVSVEQAGDLPALLAAAYSAFECALQALRGGEDHAGPLLPAFVLAAAAAADGRDAVTAAGPFAVPEPVPLENMATAAADVADQVARLSLALFARLRDAAAGEGGSACAAAAACAGRMRELLTPPG